jgi:hypothetical protein
LRRNEIFANKDNNAAILDSRSQAFQELIMATTYDGSVNMDSRSSSRPSFVRRVFDRYIESRQQAANRIIASYIGSLDPAARAQLGYTDAQIECLRSRNRGF